MESLDKEFLEKRDAAMKYCLPAVPSRITTWRGL